MSEDRLGDLLADEFVEFGSSGRMFDKRTIIERLPEERRHPEARSVLWTITEFSARQLAPRIILVTYRLATRSSGSSEARHTLRSSIWRSISGRWQMIFHQGTPVPRSLLPSN